jgi:hypothetical protein
MFVFSTTAVLVWEWHERDPAGEEAGVRLEVRLLGFAGHRGSESAAQAILVDQPVWRADLFDLVDGEPGDFARAHFHDHFDGVEPCDRCWDDDLSSDPIAWVANQLADLALLLQRAGIHVEGQLLDWVGADTVELRRAVPEIVAAAQAVLAEVRRPSALRSAGTA